MRFLFVIVVLTIFQCPWDARADVRALAAYQPSSVAVTLESAKRSYKSGESVMLNVVVHNSSSSVLDLFFSGPQNDVQLIVKGEGGGSLPPDIRPQAPLFNTSGSVSNGHLQPGETVPDTKYARGVPADIQASAEFRAGFVPSTWWGYTFTKPGSYSVAARRILVPAGVLSNMSAGVFSAPSNPITIVVTP